MGDSQPGCPSHCQPPPTELRLYQAFIFSTPILFTLVLLLLFYMLYLRRRRTTAWVASQIRAQFLARGFISVPSERGLNKSFRDMLPTVVFNESFVAAREDTQCAVCLGEYQMNEKLQQLPACGHAFHLECIDQWLANNTTCPLCRTSLLQAVKVFPLNLQNSEQEHEPIDMPRHSSQLQSLNVTENMLTQENPAMPVLTREEPSRLSDERTSEATRSINLGMNEGEIYAPSLSAGNSRVPSDCTICIDPDGTDL